MKNKSFYQLTTVLIAIFITIAMNSFAQLPDVLICGSPNTATWNDDVKAKLDATGQFNSVSIFNLTTGTPSLTQLQDHDAVLLYTDGSGCSDCNLLGNNIAAYIDGGGGVVAAVFATASIPIGGAFNSESYQVIIPAGQTEGTQTLGTILDPDHPIMNGVTSFNGGTSSYRSTSSTLAPGGYRIADWSDGTFLITAKENVGPLNVSRVDLGFFPPSIDARDDFWVTSTDGALIMANALTYVSTPCSGLTVYADTDNDNYGDISNSYFATDCVIPLGYVTDSSDCNDTNASIHPGATDLINGIDDDCNGIVDDLVCTIPVNLSIVSTTTTSARLTWDAVSGAIQYKIFYRPVGPSQWSSSLSVENTKKITGLTASTQYGWKVIAICNKVPLIQSNPSEAATFTTDPLRITDESFQLLSFQIYPNPAQDQTTIHFTLAQSSHVCVKVYDVSGKEIETLVNDELQEGEHSLLLNTDHLANGVYLVRMISELGIENQKLVVQ